MITINNILKLINLILEYINKKYHLVKMNLEQLPQDLQYDTLTNLDYPEIIALCSSNRYFRQLCSTPSFQTIIAEKRKSAIPIVKTEKSFIKFLNMYQQLPSASVHVPRPGSLIRIFRYPRPFVVLNSEINPNAPTDRGTALIYPVRRISNGYAIINWEDEPMKLMLINYGIHFFSWVDNHYTRPVEFI